MKRRLGGLFWLLVYFNLAVMCLAIAFAPPSHLPVPPDYDPLNVLFLSRKWGQFYWIVTASFFLSVGVYVFVARWLPESRWVAEEEEFEGTPLQRAIRDRNSFALEKLIEAGADVNEPDSDAYTPLMLAARSDWTPDGRELGGWTHGVQRLLEAGADVHAIARQSKQRAVSDQWTDPEKQREFREMRNFFEITAMRLADNLAIVHLLLAAGADLQQIKPEMRSRYLGLKYEGVVDCDGEGYEEGKHPREGIANPEKMEVPFWDAMVRSGAGPFAVRKQFGDEYRAGDAPVWCFQRYGNSMTQLPDGRIIEIGGQSGIYSDGRDSHIYNDVFVHYGKGRFAIYGYPAMVFPPTNWHSATLIGNDIYIIGGEGNEQERRPGFTPVYLLNCNTLAIEEVPTSGESPGWISGHNAIFYASQGDAGEVYLRGGTILLSNTGKPGKDWISNEAVFALDLASLEWRRADGATTNVEYPTLKVKSSPFNKRVSYG